MGDNNWRDYISKCLAVFFTVAMCILFYFVMFRFQEFKTYLNLIVDILKPFIYGSVIAYLLAPVCNWLEQGLAEAAELEKKSEKAVKRYKKLFSFLSILISLCLFCLIIYALIAMVVPQFISSLLLLFEALPGYIEKVTIWLETLTADNPFLLQYVEQYSEIVLDNAEDFAKTYVVPNINSIISGVSTSIWSIVNLAMDFIIGLIVAVYLLNSRRLFKRQAKMVVRAFWKGKEARAEWILEEGRILNSYLGGFVKGKLLDSLIIGLICMVFTAITEMPYAVLVSVVIGVTNIIPFFGPFIGAIPMSLLILIVSPVKCLYFVIFILVLQQFDGNILGPHILGDTTNLNSFWVLFAILLFGGLFGIVGMVIGVPLFAFFYQLFRGWVRDRLGIPRDQKIEE